MTLELTQKKIIKMSKDTKFSIHDWQDKQRLNEADEFQKRQDALTPGKNPDAFYGDDFKKMKQKYDSIASGDVFGDVNPKLEEWKQIDDMFEEVNRAAQGWLEKWINEDHIAKALEDYNQGWDDFEEKTLWALNFISTASPAEDMIGSGGTVAETNTTGTGTSISTGNSPAYATPHAFGDDKKKKMKAYTSVGYKKV